MHEDDDEASEDTEEVYVEVLFGHDYMVVNWILRRIDKINPISNASDVITLSVFSLYMKLNDSPIMEQAIIWVAL